MKDQIIEILLTDDQNRDATVHVLVSKGAQQLMNAEQYRARICGALGLGPITVEHSRIYANPAPPAPDEQHHDIGGSG